MFFERKAHATFHFLEKIVIAVFHLEVNPQIVNTVITC